MKQVHPYVYAGLTTQYTINFELIKKTVLKGYNESEYSMIWEKLISTTRKRCNVIIRQKIIYLSYLLLSPNRPSGIPESIPIKKSNNMTLKDLGEAFNRDHSTISYSTKFVQNQIDVDKKFCKEMEDLCIDIFASLGHDVKIKLKEILIFNHQFKNQRNRFINNKNVELCAHS
jgi:hypothetical protein